MPVVNVLLAEGTGGCVGTTEVEEIDNVLQPQHQTASATHELDDWLDGTGGAETGEEEDATSTGAELAGAAEAGAARSQSLFIFEDVRLLLLTGGLSLSGVALCGQWRSSGATHDELVAPRSWIRTTPNRTPAAVPREDEQQ